MRPSFVLHHPFCYSVHKRVACIFMRVVSTIYGSTCEIHLHQRQLNATVLSLLLSILFMLNNRSRISHRIENCERGYFWTFLMPTANWKRARESKMFLQKEGKFFMLWKLFSSSCNSQTYFVEKVSKSERFTGISQSV